MNITNIVDFFELIQRILIFIFEKLSAIISRMSIDSF